MTAFVSALTGTDGISETALWGGITPMAPLIVILVVFAFSYRVARRSIGGASKGKVKI